MKSARHLTLILCCATCGCATLLGLDDDYRDQTSSATGAGAGDGSSGRATAGSSATGGKASTPSGGTSSTLGGERASSGGETSTVDGLAGSDGGGSPPGYGGEPTTGGAISPLLRVIHGETTLAAGSATQQVAAVGVDAGRAFVVFGSSFDSSNSSRTEVSGQLGAGTVTFKRLSNSTAAPNVPISYYIAEFGDGVLVQRGSATLQEAVTHVPLATAVALDRSFPIVTFRNAGSVYGLDDHVRAKLTAPSELTLEMYQAFGDGVVEWQVVSFAGATVQSGDVAIQGAALETKAALATALDPASTWLLLSYRVADIGAGAADLMLRGRAETDQVVFTRSATGASATLTYYAVSFTNGTRVQNGNLGLGDTAKTAQAALDDIEVDRSIAVAAGNYQRSGSTAYAAANNPGYSSFRLALEANRLSATRGAAVSGGSANLSFTAIQFQ
jgi:hypothetical protein